MHEPDTTRNAHAAKGEAGFSLIDVCVTLFVCVVVIYALHSGTRTAMNTRRVVESNYQLQLFANDFVNRLRRLPFGNPGASVATPQQLDDLFDADQDLGTVTLSQLRCAATEDGYSFKLGGNELNRTWRVRVTSDVNGDGDELDEREARSDLVRMEIYYDNRLVVETLRAAESNMTVPDVSVNYITGPIPEPPPPTTIIPPPPPAIEGEPPPSDEVLPAIEPPADETDPGLLPAVEPDPISLTASSPGNGNGSTGKVSAKPAASK
ncbi:MAG: hypothetical protein H6833_06730 [Planctomycetes bacterium]|nr:hypothetical protein [Planctomycetota bacterium]